MNGRVRKSVVSAVVAASLMGAGVPVSAFASESTSSLQTRLSDARARFDELAMASAELGEALNDTYYQLDQTRESKEKVSGQIEQTQKVLNEARDVLSNRISANYRAGSSTMIDMLLGCTSVEDFVDTIYYFDKVHESDVNAINAVQTAQAQLEKQENELSELEQSQSELATQQEDQAAKLDEAVAAQASYINGLDGELRTKLEEQRAAEVAAQQAAAARAMGDGGQVSAPLQWQNDVQEAPKASAANDSSTSETASQTQKTSEDTSSKTEQTEPAAPASTTESTSSATEQKSQEAAQPAAEQSQSTQETETAAPAAEPAAAEPAAAESAAAASEEASSSSTSSSTRDAIVAAAYSQLGVPYVYGAESPGEALDCSGFTQYCYSQAGIDIPHSSVGQAGMADKSSIDDLQAGDLVFWEGTAGGSASGSHVAIYLGDGQIIHANGTEVAVGTLSDTYTSCGSIS